MKRIASAVRLTTRVVVAGILVLVCASGCAITTSTKAPSQATAAGTGDALDSKPATGDEPISGTQSATPVVPIQTGAPTTVPTTPTPSTCPDPSEWSVEALAQFLVVPGFPGDYGVPDYITGGQAGLFVTTGWQGLATGAFESNLPDEPKPFVAIDYEGGLVSRHKELLGQIPSPREQAATMTPAQVRELAAEAGRTMRTYGVTLDFAPVADLDLGSPIVDTRSYGSDPAQVVTYAGAFSDGLREAGVQPVLKHFPGHGSADGDSHAGAVTTQPWETVRSRDVQVFTELLQRPGPWMVMMGHMIVPGLSSEPDLPTSVDPAAYQALRAETGFTGPVITDDLSRMRAVLDLYSTPEAVVAAIDAGADLALLSLPENYWESVQSLAAWAAADPYRQASLIDSARRVMTIMPCS